MKTERSWNMYAQDLGDGHLSAFGEEWWSKLHGDEPVIPVKLIEDPEGDFYGWLETDSDTPCMIWGTKIQFEMCFPYGVQSEVDLGRGKPIRLRCERV